MLAGINYGRAKMNKKKKKMQKTKSERRESFAKRFNFKHCSRKRVLQSMRKEKRKWRVAFDISQQAHVGKQVER